MTMTDETQPPQPTGPNAGARNADTPIRGSGTGVGAPKPSSRMTYVVQKGANIVPSWLTSGQSAATK